MYISSTLISYIAFTLGCISSTLGWVKLHTRLHLVHTITSHSHSTCIGYILSIQGCTRLHSFTSHLSHLAISHLHLAKSQSHRLNFSRIGYIPITKATSQGLISYTSFTQGYIPYGYIMLHFIHTGPRLIHTMLHLIHTGLKLIHTWLHSSPLG
jgi:hypothetical protein